MGDKVKVVELSNSLLFGRSFNNDFEQLQYIMAQNLSDSEKKLLAPELDAFKIRLTEQGVNQHAPRAMNAALKDSEFLTKAKALLIKTADSSNIQAAKSSATTTIASIEALKPAKLELIKGGDYRLIYDATNLQGNSHQVVSELRVAAERQGITARASYHMVGNNRREMTIIFEGTAKAGKFLRVNEATALFVDTANLLADSAQKYAALGQEKLAAEYLRKANQYNPIADYKPANFPAVASSDAERVKIATELKSLRETLKVNRGEFAQLTKAERLEYIPKAVTEVAGASSEASPLMLAKATSRGWPRLLGTAGGYALLLEGLVAATGAVSDKLHQADLKDALEAQARLNYARTHQNLRNDDAIRDVEFNR